MLAGHPLGKWMALTFTAGVRRGDGQGEKTGEMLTEFSFRQA